MTRLLVATLCFWQFCKIIGGDMSACSDYGHGTEQEMYRFEKERRGKGALFLRECVEPGETPELGWNRHGTFMKEDRHK